MIMDEKQIEGRIHTLKVLRDAQVEGDPHWQAFQEQITELTGTLFEVQREAPRRAKLDEELKAAQVALSRAREAADTGEDPWLPLAVACGVIGALCLLVWLWLAPGPVLCWFAVAFLAGGVGGLMASIRWRRDGQVRVTEAQVSLERLVADRGDG
jgi:hypothetical protein